MKGNLSPLAVNKERFFPTKTISNKPPAPNLKDAQPETKIDIGGNSPAQAQPDLLSEAKEFILRIAYGNKLDESSINQGLDISRQIECKFAKSEADLEQGLGPLFVEQGKILNCYKTYAQGLKKSWEEMAEQWFPHIKKRKRQNLMFFSNHPEFLQYLHLGFDRMLRFYRAGKKFDRKEGMGKMIEIYNLHWFQNGCESLLDFRMRVDKAISDVYGQMKPAARSLNQLVSDLRNWMSKGRSLIEEVLSNETACGRLGIVDVESIEQSIVKLREAIEVAA